MKAQYRNGMRFVRRFKEQLRGNVRFLEYPTIMFRKDLTEKGKKERIEENNNETKGPGR